MKVLVTGSKGFIGQNMCKALKSNNIDFDAFDILDGYTRPKNLNITDYNWVIHLGAISSTTETDIKKIMDLNVSWSIELFEECKKYNTNLQWASSASVYGKRNISSGLFKESDICKPENYYAMSKYLIEKYIEKSNYNTTVQGFRYFNVYGDYEDHKGSQASPVHQFTKQAKETGIIKIFENSDKCLRDFVPVHLVVDTHIKMLRIKQSGVYNIGTGTTKSFLQIAEEVAKKYNAIIQEIPFPESLKTQYQYYTCSDNTKINNTLPIL